MYSLALYAGTVVGVVILLLVLYVLNLRRIVPTNEVYRSGFNPTKTYCIILE